MTQPIDTTPSRARIDAAARTLHDLHDHGARLVYLGATLRAAIGEVTTAGDEHSASVVARLRALQLAYDELTTPENLR